MATQRDNQHRRKTSYQWLARGAPSVVMVCLLAACDANLKVTGVNNTQAVDGSENEEPQSGLPGVNSQLKPIPEVIAQNVCVGKFFLDLDGNRIEGTRDCSTPHGVGDCKVDGQKDCISTAAFPAVARSGLADKILVGASVAGVVGTYSYAPSECSEAGQQNCIAQAPFRAASPCEALGSDCYVPPYGSGSSPYKAVNVAAIEANKAYIRDNLTLAGVTGTLEACTGSNQSGCLANSSYVAAQARGSLDAESAFSGAGYYTGVTNLPAATTLATTANVFGVVGTAKDLCASGGSEDCIAQGSFKVAQDCSSNNEIGCLATASYVAAESRGLLDASLSFPGAGYYTGISNVPDAGQIKSAETVLGVTGDFPSATYPLDGADATADLDDSTFLAKVKSDTDFEYWDSTGTRHVSAGDSDILEENLITSATVFGVTGSAPNPQCTATDQANCEGDSACRWSGASCEINPWNVRVGISLMGQSGTIKMNCRNSINSAVYNQGSPPNDGGGTPDSVLDWWDTIDNMNNFNASLPTELPLGWTTDTQCGKELWSDITDDGSGDTQCDEASDDCLLLDNVTRLVWSESVPQIGNAPDTGATTDWSDAVSVCDSLNYGSSTDWRLPTFAELAQSVTHNIRQVGHQGGGTIRPGGDTTDNNDSFLLDTDQMYWSATTWMGDQLRAWTVNLSRGEVNFTEKTESRRFVCVREL